MTVAVVSVRLVGVMPRHGIVTQHVRRRHAAARTIQGQIDRLQRHMPSKTKWAARVCIFKHTYAEIGTVVSMNGFGEAVFLSLLCGSHVRIAAAPRQGMLPRHVCMQRRARLAATSTNSYTRCRHDTQLVGRNPIWLPVARP